MADTFATRDGDDIVIRVPVGRLEEILAAAGRGSTLRDPVTIERPDEFIDEIVAQINGVNAVESMMTCEVGGMIEAGSRTVKEHRAA